MSDEEKFTPGPWVVSGRYSEDYYLPGWGVGTEREEALYACSVAQCIENKADANLISAAPDLIAIVEEYVREAEGMGYEPADYPLVAEAIAALKKAKGEA